MTWEGISKVINNAIRTYDNEVIVPRIAAIDAKHSASIVQLEVTQNRRHEENTSWLERLDKAVVVLAGVVDGLKTVISEWKWPVRIAMAMLSAILLGVIGLVLDMLRWGAVNHWKY